MNRRAIPIVIWALLVAGCGSSTAGMSDGAASVVAPGGTAAQRAERALISEERAHGQSPEQYSGLGASRQAFTAHHTVTEGAPPANPVNGTTEDEIAGVASSGRVTKYVRTFHFDPARSPGERLALVAGADLPGVPTVVRQTSTCVDWRSPVLRQLIGLEYAQAITQATSISVTVEAVARPSC
jgi:hypothetical protein